VARANFGVRSGRWRLAAHAFTARIPRLWSGAILALPLVTTHKSIAFAIGRPRSPDRRCNPANPGSLARRRSALKFTAVGLMHLIA